MGPICESVKNKPEEKTNNEENYHIEHMNKPLENPKREKSYQESDYVGTENINAHYFFPTFLSLEINKTKPNYLNKVNKNLWISILRFLGDGKSYEINCWLRNKKFLEICKLIGV